MFKVFDRTNDGKLHSVSPPIPALSLTYEVGKWTYPDVGGILVFRSQRDAEHFRSHEVFTLDNLRMPIYKVDTDKAIFRPPNGLSRRHMRELTDATLIEAVKMLWEGHGGEEIIQLVAADLKVHPWPIGTWAVSAVRPIREITL